ncbi:MAG: hypothetical protein WD053_05470 [Gracilimonas sp.]
MTVGGYNKEIARFIYKHSRKIINMMVKTGKIAAENADKEWAKMVAKKLLKVGAEVPKHILRMLK